MQLQKLIRRRIRRERNGVSLASDVNVAVSGNVGERGGVTHVSSQQRTTDETGTKRTEQEAP